MKNYTIAFPDIPCDGEVSPDPFRAVTEARNDEPPLDLRYVTFQAQRLAEWTTLVREYEADPEDFFTAWLYLDSHPAFWVFHDWVQDPARRFHERYLDEYHGVQRRVEVYPTKVDPVTNEVNLEDKSKNTKTYIWLETGKTPWPTVDGDEHCNFHSYLFDCGGDTYEAAIVALAKNVHDGYGNDRRVCDGVLEKPETCTPVQPGEE